MEVSGRRLWMILLAATLWGTVGVCTQALYRLTATNPLSVGFFRLAFAVPVLTCACVASQGWRSLRITRGALVRMLLIGLMLALYQACFFAAIAQVGIAVATLVTLCLAPVLVALLSAAVLGERLTPPALLALLLALGGIAGIVGSQGSYTVAGHSGNQGLLAGILLATGSALGYAIVTLAGRTIAGRYSALQINTVAFATGALALLPVAVVTGFVIRYPVQGWLLLIYLGLVPTACGYVLFFMGIRSTPATMASIATLLEPLVATILAWLLFGERLSALGLLGATLLLGALVVLTLSAAGRTDAQTTLIP